MRPAVQIPAGEWVPTCDSGAHWNLRWNYITIAGVFGGACNSGSKAIDWITGDTATVRGSLADAVRVLYGGRSG